MIVSSQIEWDQRQTDGRRSVREVHTDNLGAVHVVDYLAEPGADTRAILLARVPLLEAQIANSLAAREKQVNLDVYEEAKDVYLEEYLAGKADAEIIATLKLPADFVVPHG